MSHNSSYEAFTNNKEGQRFAWMMAPQNKCIADKNDVTKSIQDLRTKNWNTGEVFNEINVELKKKKKKKGKKTKQTQ